MKYGLRYLLASLLALLSPLACGDDGSWQNVSDAHFLPTDAIPDPPFLVTQLEPPHGPASGGNQVTVRGFGFEEGSRVYFGERLIDPQLTVFEAQNRMRILAPAGSPGSVDVRVQRPDGLSATLAHGYAWDPLAVDPSSGSISGGTFVRVKGAGTSFDPADVVTFGGEPLEDQTWVSPVLITGHTPAHAAGDVTVAVDGPGGAVAVSGAFTYYDSADPINGGLGGGKIAGEVNVTVLDAYTDEPVADAYVLMGPNASSPYQAVTDGTGRVTFSAPGLEGPQMVTVAAEDYERVSIIAFDARDVTVFLTPFVPPSSGSFPGTAYSLVTGWVSFGGVEFGQGCDFDMMLPPPAAGEVRVIKVYQSVSDYDYVAAEPGDGGTIYEGVPCDSAYAFSIYARPGAYAIYALAGIETQATGAFVPHAIGVTRGLLSGPGQVIAADLLVDLPLDRSATFDLGPAPPLDPVNGPLGYKLRLFTDLGGDGYIVRLDTQRSTTDASTPVVVDRLAVLDGALADASYSAMVEAHTNGIYPYAKVFLPTICVGGGANLVEDWVGIPHAVDPAPGGTPSTSRMIWTATGTTPSFNVVLVKTFPEGDLYWRVYTDGRVQQFVLPDLYGLGPGLDGHPAGEMYWNVIPVLVEGMDFNDFSYRYLNDSYWKATSGHGFTFRFPDPE